MSEETEAYYKGEFFVEFDDEMWCIFHTDYKQGFCFGVYGSESEAERVAKEKNENKIQAAEFNSK